MAMLSNQIVGGIMMDVAMSQTTHQIDGWNPTHKNGDSGDGLSLPNINGNKYMDSS